MGVSNDTPILISRNQPIGLKKLWIINEIQLSGIVWKNKLIMDQEYLWKIKKADYMIGILAFIIAFYGLDIRGYLLQRKHLKLRKK